MYGWLSDTLFYSVCKFTYYVVFYGMYGWLSDTLFYSVCKFTYYVVFSVCMDDCVTFSFTLCTNLRAMLYFRYVWMTVWHLVLLCVQIYVLCCILWCVRMIEWYFVFPGMQIYLQCLFYGMYGWLSDTLFYSVSKFTYYVVFYVRPDITVMVDWAQNIKLPTSHFMCSRKANFCFSSRQ